METKYYTCQYCQQEYTPKRRRVQKFCSVTCRVKKHHAKKELEQKNKIIPTKSDTLYKPTNNEQLSLAGIGNAAIGNLAADGVKELLKQITGNASLQNASKRDLQNLTNAIQKMTDQINKRYFLVHGLAPRYDGALPYFDMGTSSIVYLKI